MAQESINRCVWLVDTIRRYGRITRRELEQRWLDSPYSNGRPLSRRTFCNHRDAVEELFKIRIECDRNRYEYYIADEDPHDQSMTNWLLNSMTLNDVLSESRDISDRIFVEDVPSARDHLVQIITALKQHHPIEFTYRSYTRSMPTPGVVLEPYFLKLFKQRWYVIGRHVQQDRIKTYALDRMTRVEIKETLFRDDPDFDPDEYFRHSYGIVESHGEVRKVVLRVDPRQAKYFNALPLHSSQSETLHDNYSLFTYRLRITDDFVEELLSHGPRVTVLEPPELRAKMRHELSEALLAYAE